MIVHPPLEFFHGSNILRLAGENQHHPSENLLPYSPMNDYTSSAVAFCDGGCRPNPGHSACAVVLYVDGSGYTDARYLSDHGTVNTAEYEGLLMAMSMALRLGVKHLRIRMDSRLVVEQVLGSWKVKEPSLVPYVARARDLAQRFDGVEIKHVPREENVVADALVTALLDDHTGVARQGGSRRTLVTA
jgi:ribonuclease HI